MLKSDRHSREDGNDAPSKGCHKPILDARFDRANGPCEIRCIQRPQRLKLAFDSLLVPINSISLEPWPLSVIAPTAEVYS
jgi:hypothetical protein